MKKLTSNVLVALLAMSLASCGILGTSYDADKPPVQPRSLTEAKSDLTSVENANWEENAKYIFDPEIRYINVDEPIAVQTNGKDILFDYETSPEKPRYWSAVRAYLDLGLTVETTLTSTRNEKGETLLSPFMDSPIYQMRTKKAKSTKPANAKLIERNNWGLIDQFYLVTYNDLQTGKLLPKPIVTTYKVKHPDKKDLKRPQVEMSFSENGAMLLDWKAVQNAEEYWVMRTSVTVYEKENEEAPTVSYHTQIIAKTNEPSWSTGKEAIKREWILDDISDRSAIIEDQLIAVEKENPEKAKKLRKERENSKDESFLTVVAVKGGKLSPVSNRISIHDYKDKLVLRSANNTWDLEVKHSKEHRGIFDNLEDFPKELPFIMASGKTQYLPVMPEPDKSEVIDGKLIVAVIVREANLGGKLTVKKFPTNWKDFLVARAKEIKERRTGTNTQISVTEADENDKAPEVTENDTATEKNNEKNTDPDKNQDSQNQPEDKTKEISTEVATPYGDRVFATNPLSYRLAVALLNNQEIVDISGLPGAGDLEYVRAAIAEAITQTPHAATINDARIWTGSRVRFIYAVPDRNLRIKKAEAARNELRRVLKEMNLDGLDDIEKLRRINQWTYLNTEYNYSALDFLRTGKPITPELDSNWTTYGPAIDHLAVCEGYSEAFVFLARESGFDAIGVTGSINGDASVGHKWAAVKINGEWRYFDPTWNDAEGYEEHWFNLPVDHPIMTEYHNPDRRYVVSTYINDYR